MAKSKAPKYIRDRRKEQSQSEQRTTESWWKLPSKIVGWILAVVGLAAAIVTFLPKLSLDVSGSLRPHDPVGTVFYLSNEGMLPVYDIVVTCRIHRLDTAILQPKISNSSFTFDSASKLAPGKKLTLQCQRAINLEQEEITGVDMTVEVNYRPLLVWWRRTESFPVLAERTQTGEWIWKNKPE